MMEFDNIIQELINRAIEEDIGSGDVTSEYFVDERRDAVAVIAARAEGVVSGLEVAAQVFQTVDLNLRVSCMVEDGNRVGVGALLMRIEGRARSILTAERTALNFLQHLSGISTMTANYVSRVAHTKTKILDTRKTTPGYRILEKKAVLDGGGTNHRMGLYDRAMVKDNHLASFDGLAELQASILRLKDEKPGVEVEVEADTLEQVEQFLGLQGIDYILLDNMSNQEMSAAVEMAAGHPVVRLEASGGITIERLAEIAETGVDFISVGALTHSPPALDVGMDFISDNE